MSRQELVDVVDIAQTVPSLPENNIKRDNVIFTIERLFNKGIEVVAVEGDEGLGKSTLLRQFCERNTKNTISIFVKAFNTLAYDLSNLRFDVANQVYWIINGKQLGVDEEVDAGKLREYIFQLQRIAKRRNKKYYFIIDGLFDHDGDIEINRKLLLDSLPIGLQHFQFLISGDIEEILGQSKNKIKAKSVQNPSFTYHEAESFLGDIVTKKEDLEELYRASDGIPAYLDTIRRILQNGTDISVLIDELPEHLKDFYEIEWSRIDEGNEDGKLLLAVLAFDKRQMDVDEISVLLSKDNKEIIKFVESLTFIRFDEETKVIEYVSSSFKKFAKSQLDAYKGHANDLVIENLWRKQNDGKSMSMLPSYLMESGRYKDILKVLSTDKLCKYLDVTSSLSSLQRQAGIGIDAAGKLRIDGELLRFVNIKSFLNDLGFSEESKNEIEALIATKKYDEAISIANSAILIEDRLYLLSVVAKCRSKNGENVESALKENIQKLYYQIDVESIDREKSLEIAIELFSTFPDLAISLVEKSSGSSNSDNSLDWAIANLSLHTVLSEDSKSSSSNMIDDLYSRADNQALKSFLTAASAVVNDPSIKTIIEQINKLEKTADKLFVVRNILRDIKSNENCLELVEYALDLIITSTEYSPNAAVYRELTSCLCNVSDVNGLERVIGLVDGQKNSIYRIGPTEEFVRLQLNLAQADEAIDIERSRNRVVEIYLDSISEISDVAVKANCLSWLAATLEKIDSSEELEEKEGLRSIVEDELKSSIGTLLNTTAEQFEAVKNVLLALSPSCLGYAVQIAESLNIITRRDEAFSHIVFSATNKKFNDKVFYDVCNIIHKIDDIYIKDGAIVRVVEAITDDMVRDSKIIESVIELIKSISDVEEKCNSFVLMYSRAKEHDSIPGDTKNILRTGIFDTWNNMSEGWKRISIAFKSASLIAKVDSDLGSELMNAAYGLKKELLILSENDAEILRYMLLLLLGSYRGLLESGIADSNDFNIVEKSVKFQDSFCEKAKMWGFIACVHYLNNDIKSCKNIVFNYLRPCIDSISDYDCYSKYEAMMYTGPALWVAHKETAKESIDNLPRFIADKVYYSICNFYLNKSIPGLPHEKNKNFDYDILYPEIVDIINMLGNMESDSMIYLFIEQIVNAVKKLEKEAKINRTQIEDVENKVESIINNNLPSERYIKHNGFKIGAIAQLLRLKKNRSHWDELVKDVSNIVNIADQALVYMFIADAMPAKYQSRRTELLKKAEQLIDDVPSVYDRLDRYESLADYSLDIDPAYGRSIVKKAFSLATSHDDKSLRNKQKDIVDLAYRIDQDLPASLASISNDDPASNSSDRLINERIDFLELKSQVQDERNLNFGENAHDNKELPNAAWKLWGSLLSNRTSPLHRGCSKLCVTSLKLNVFIQSALKVNREGVQNSVSRV